MYDQSCLARGRARRHPRRARSPLELRHSVLAGVILFFAALPLRAAEAPRTGIDTAGVCSRCHVTSSIEWGISRHSRRNIGCMTCHGESKAHVADEQNNVKPDRLPRGEAIAALCLQCHGDGCPKTKQTTSCQDCHHAHALVNPKLDASAIGQHADQLAAKTQASEQHLAEGKRLVQAQKWEAARAEFRAALTENPANPRAKAALQMCERRLNPGLTGFNIVGNEFDPATGLPKEMVVDGLGINLVLVPGGSFDMGSDRHGDTKPVHTVDVAPFYLAKYEMTQAQWKSLMGTNTSFYQGEQFPDADRFPAEQVSWEDCQTLLGIINKRVPAGGFRLPTEAEWEYAARAGASDSLQSAQLLRSAWLQPNSEPVPAVPPVRTSYYLVGSGVTATPHPVGTSEPNRWGLYDMLGNVSEWCSSLLMSYPYSATDGRESAADPGIRVLRGGNYGDFIEMADVCLRHSDRPNRRLRWNGVRLAFSPPEEK